MVSRAATSSDGATGSSGIIYLTKGTAVLEHVASGLRIATIGEMSFFSPALAASAAVAAASDSNVFALQLRAIDQLDYLEVQLKDFFEVFSQAFVAQLQAELQLQLVWWNRRIQTASNPSTKKKTRALPRLALSLAPSKSPQLAARPKANLTRLKAQLPTLLRPIKPRASDNLQASQSARSAAFRSFILSNKPQLAPLTKPAHSTLKKGEVPARLWSSTRLADKAWCQRSNTATLGHMNTQKKL